VVQGNGDTNKTNRADNRAVEKKQLSASEIQAFIEASLDLAPLAFSQRITQLMAAPVAACLSVRFWRLIGRGVIDSPKNLKPAHHADQTCSGVK
jgi:hypothetical protein